MSESRAGLRKGLLQKAKKSIIVEGDLDTTAQLALHNLFYGMGRILWVLRQSSRHTWARFYASSDFTITRTPVRWGSGFSYGGALEIGDCDYPIVFPELRPNTCGAALSYVDGELSRDEFVRRVARIRFAHDAIDWDYGKRNHFVNLYRSARSGRQVVAVHGCPSRCKADNEDGPGLFFDKSDYWSARTQWVTTPLGPCATLVEGDANDFWKNYQRCEQISKEERLAIAHEAGGDGAVICNETHEGMTRLNLYMQGCQIAHDLESSFPVFTDIASEAYLVTASESTPSCLPRRVAGILPHGTGYELPLPSGHVELVEGYPRPIYLVRHPNGTAQAYANFANVPYKYRSADIVKEWERLGRLNIVDQLLPLAFTKL